MQSFLRVFALSVVFLLLAGFGQVRQRGHAPRPHHVSIARVHNIWKAVRRGTDSTEVRVDVADTVYFHAEGSDVYFQFDNKNLFGVENQMVKSGHWIFLVVKPVQPGPYTYSAFCEAQKVFAQGDSPPKIIVN